MDRENTVATFSDNRANASAPDAAPGTSVKASSMRTFGVNAFDAVTYGGLALGGNEAISTVVIGSVEEGRLKPAFDKFSNFLRNLKPLQKIHYVTTGRLGYLLVACIGGFIPVPAVKWMEDHKGPLVRRADRWKHGPNADNDPRIAAAHEEMDQSPKQSWRSLGEGRVVTVGSAIAMDWVIGWPRAWSGLLADKFDLGKFKDFASFDRLGASVGRQLGVWFDREHAANIKQVLATVTDPKDRYEVSKLGKRGPAGEVLKLAEGKVAYYGTKATSLLTLSLSLTALFYVTSKMFARGQENRRERKLGIDPETHLPLPAGMHADKVEADISTASAPITAEAPITRVAQVENLSRLGADPIAQAKGA